MTDFNQSNTESATLTDSINVQGRLNRKITDLTHAVDGNTILNMDSTSGWSGFDGGSISLNTTTFHEGTGAINLYNASSDVTTALYYTWGTPANFEEVSFGFWVYLSQAAKDDNTYLAISFIDSGGSNYIRWYAYSSNLQVGWNHVVCNLNNVNYRSSGINLKSMKYLQITRFNMYSGITGVGDLIFDDVHYLPVQEPMENPKYLELIDSMEAIDNIWNSIDWNLNALETMNLSDSFTNHGIFNMNLFDDVANLSDAFSEQSRFTKILTESATLTDSFSRTINKRIYLKCFIGTNYPVPIVAHWKMNETSGNAIDSVNGYNGTINGVLQNQAGKIDKSYYFSDDCITRGPVPLNSSPFSICAWVNYTIKANGEDNHQIIALNWNWTAYQGYGYQIIHNNGAPGKQTISCGRTSSTSTSTVPAGEWHHVCVTHDGTTVRFYLDGVYDGGGANTLYPDTTNLTIGKESNSASWRDFLGYMDDLRVYNIALSQDQIDAIVNGGTGTELDETDTTPNPNIHTDFSRFVSDVINFSDTINKQSIFNKNLTEVLNIFSTFSYRGIFNKIISESMTLIDSMVKTFNISKLFSDSIIMSDVCTRTIKLNINFAESLTLLDSLTFYGSKDLRLYDMISLFDAMNMETLYRPHTWLERMNHGKYANSKMGRMNATHRRLVKII